MSTITESISSGQSSASGKPVDTMSETTTSDTCPCILVKEYRYNCGHSILRKGGSHKKHPACLVHASSHCTQLGDVRRIVFIINGVNTDFQNLTPNQCFECRAEVVFRARQPEATSAQVRTHVRRAMQESGIPQEQRACDTLLSTSRGRTKHITKGQKGYTVARAKEQLEGHLFGSPKGAHGKGPKANNDMMYWLAGEVLSLCEILGDLRLMRHFGKVIYLRCAGHIQQYVRDANPGLADAFDAAVGPRLARRENNELQNAKEAGAAEETVKGLTTAEAKLEEQKAQEKPEEGRKKTRKMRNHRGKKPQQTAQVAPNEPRALRNENDEAKMIWRI